MAIFGLGDDKTVTKAKTTKKDVAEEATKVSDQDDDAGAVLAELEEKEKNSDTCAFC